MEYLSFDPSTKNLSLEHGEIPKPGPDEILVRVHYSGICGTDLHILDGSFPAKSDGNLTLGHEFSGVIEDVGSIVKGFKIGQSVAIDPNSGCNKCDFCHTGKYHFCDNGGINNTIGIFRNGGWSTHAVVPESQVYLLPSGVEMPQAALAEPLSCLAHGWDIINPVTVGTNILVIGSGIIGLLWACLLHLHGSRKTVTISEPIEARREAVKKLDLDYEINSPGQLKDKKFDLAIDCSGSGPAMEAAVPLLKRGGRLCVFGVANPKATLTISPFDIYMKELTILGVNINPFTFPKGLALVRAMSKQYLIFDNLGIKVYKLSEYKDAFDALKKGVISKAIFKCC